MFTLILKRLLWTFCAVTIITVVIFFLLRLIPGDPASLMAPQATEEARQLLRERMGLTDPLHIQYSSFLANAIKGDFGESIYFTTPVSTLIINRFKVSLPLLIGASLFSLLISTLLGVLGALNPKSFIDRTIFTVSVLFKSAPSFWLGLVLIVIFALNLNLLPAFGYVDWRYLILPILTLSIPLIPAQSRTIRDGMEEILGKDFIKFARARGINNKKTIWKYGFANEVLPLLSVLSVQIGILLGEIIIIEWVFNYPGIGLMTLYAVLRRDYPLVQGIVFIFALICALRNAGVDVLRIIIDPRIRIHQNKG